MKPKLISDIELAFPAHVIGKYLPVWETIPDEFRNYRSPWCHHAQAAFSGKFDAAFTLRDGVDIKLASRHLRACLSSYEPKHEHKIAGVAYLMSLWFEIVEESA